MHELLVGLLIAGATAWAIALLAVLWVRHRLRRELRIAPTVRSSAPTVWLASPTAAARLHRRLRRAAATARAASALEPSLRPLADEVVREALALEPVTVAVARTGRSGWTCRRDLSVRISDLENVATALTTRSTQAASSNSTATRTRERLAALDAAHQELADIDLRAGVARHA